MRNGISYWDAEWPHAVSSDAGASPQASPDPDRYRFLY
jgi:hypothetical protein